MRDAERLRSLHVPGQPLLLANVWDPPSAAAVAASGPPAVATTSAAVAACLGYADNGEMPPDVAFAAVARIAAAVDVPVTADIEDGYGLGAAELVERLVAAGASGCNLEDTDHRGGGLVGAGPQADRLAAVRTAAGDDLVLNARVDVWMRGGTAAEGMDRAVRYSGAGADCVYPIGVTDLGLIRELVAAAGPVNALLRKGGPTVAELAAAGVARISLGSGLWRFALRRIADALTALSPSTGAEDQLWS